MARLIRTTKTLEKGEFINKYFESRVIRNNKNALGVTLGPTGSGKSYTDLSIMEGWYKYHFKKEFPIENVCFSLGAFMKRIYYLQQEGKLKRGTGFILEEMGANFGNLDFQRKLSKMFSYILQSFRSMNLIVLMNVPNFSMINKQARQLVHFKLSMKSINMEEEIAKVDMKIHQINDHTGKSYWKYPRAKIKGKIRKLERLCFIKPSQRIINLYEKDKSSFVIDLTQEFILEVVKQDKENEMKDARKDLTKNELKVKAYVEEGLYQEEIAEKMGCSQSNISQIKRNVEKKGYKIHNPLENEV